jgi:plasmid stability protein
MAQFVVRHLEDDVADKLKARARRAGRSTEEEVRHILRHAVLEPPRPAIGLGSRIAKRFRRAGLARDLPEWRGRAAGAADFDR